MQAADVAGMSEPVAGSRPRLEQFLSDTHAQLHQLGDAIASLHFEGGPLPQPISSLSMTELMGVPS